jgi:hypothetical protein
VNGWQQQMILSYKKRLPTKAVPGIFSLRTGAGEISARTLVNIKWIIGSQNE